jgi:hypothetical protein
MMEVWRDELLSHRIAMEKVYSGDLIKLRLFAKQEGAGDLLVAVPRFIQDTAVRTSVEGFSPGYAAVRAYRDKVTFQLRSELRPYLADWREIGPRVLRLDARNITHLLTQISAAVGPFELDLNPVSSAEMQWMQDCLGDPSPLWARGIVVRD